MAHRCINGFMPETNYTHGKCKLNAGKSHYASTCPFTWNFKKCPQFEENLNYEVDKKNEAIAAQEARLISANGS